MNLDELAIKYGTDKSHAVHNYTKVYEDIFIGRKVKSMLEIGVHTGASHRMWRDYFPKATIYAIDHNEFNTGSFGELGERIVHYVANQGKAEELEGAMSSFNTTFDLIIDDGSHVPEDIMVSLNTLFKYLNDGGLYIIEDVSDVGTMKHSLYGYEYWTANTVNGLYNSNLIIIKKV